MGNQAVLFTPTAHAGRTVHIVHLVPMEFFLQPNSFCFTIHAPVIYLPRSVYMPAPQHLSLNQAIVRVWVVCEARIVHTLGRAVQASLAGPVQIPNP